MFIKTGQIETSVDNRKFVIVNGYETPEDKEGAEPQFGYSVFELFPKDTTEGDKTEFEAKTFNLNDENDKAAQPMKYIADIFMQGFLQGCQYVSAVMKQIQEPKEDPANSDKKIILE